MSEPLVTPEATLLYNRLFKPWKCPQYPSSVEKYSAMLLFDPKDSAARPLLQQHKADMAEKWPQGAPKLDFSNCILRAEDRFPNHPEWKGLLVLNTSKKPDFGVPKVLSNPTTPIVDATEIYAGIRVRAHINLWTFARGIAAELHAIMKVADGEPVSLGNAPDSKAAFAEYAGDSNAEGFEDFDNTDSESFI